MIIEQTRIELMRVFIQKPINFTTYNIIYCKVKKKRSVVTKKTMSQRQKMRIQLGANAANACGP